MEYNLPNRKSTRLKGYDYSQAGVYFVTICAENRMNILGVIGGEESMLKTPQITLNHAGQMIEKILLGLQNEFDNVLIDRYVIMPNHLHCIVSIKEDTRAHMECAPTALGNIVQSFKRHTTIEYIKGVKSGTYPPFEKRVWQRNYYEHIIRNDEDYLRICQYIDENPIKWTQDEYYVT